MVFQGAIGHELVHQESLITIGAIPNKIDEVRMVKEAEHEDFDEELFALQAIPVELFNSHGLGTEKTIIRILKC